MQFVPTALLYTCAYATAVVADHASSLAAMKAGAVETNVLFQTPGHALAEGRAVIVFLLLWPVMLALLWLADRRGRGLAREPGWLVRQLIGRRAETTALLPIVAIFAKVVCCRRQYGDRPLWLLHLHADPWLFIVRGRHRLERPVASLRLGPAPACFSHRLAGRALVVR